MIIFILSGDLHAQTLYKCTLENGTLSYQKEPCIADDSTILENLQKQKIKKNNSKKNQSQESLETYLLNNIREISTDVGEYNISVLKLKNWRVFKKILSNNMMNLKFLDETSGSEASLLMDYVLFDNNKTFTQKQLSKTLIEMGKGLLSATIENKVEPVNFNVTDGIGVMAQFTDTNLINKLSYPPGEYLHITKGLIYKNNLYVHFTLLSNNLEGINHIVALEFLSNSIIVKKSDSSQSSTKSLDPLDQSYKDYNNGNKRESVAMFKNIVSNDPANIKAWIGYCMALRDTNRLQSAFIACDKALSLDVGNPAVYESLLNLYTISRLWEYGFAFLEKYAPKSDNKELLDAINNFGFYAMLDGKLKVANKAFNRVKDEGGNSIKVNIDLATVKYLNGQKEDAIKDLDRLLKKDSNNSYLLSILKLMKSNQSSIIPSINELPYMVVPDRLAELGSGKNINQKPDEWVRKIFPVKGIGDISLEVPESWYEHVQITASDNSHNKIAIKILDIVSLTMITIDVGKVDDDWNMINIKKQLKAGLSIFFDETNINLTRLGKNRKGYSFTGITDGENHLYIHSQHELNGKLYIKSLIIESEKTNSVSEISNRIISNIKISKL